MLKVRQKIGKYRILDSERERDIRAWETRHSIVADSRAAAVDEWISEQFRTMRDLAENASLQLYMTEIALVRAGREGAAASSGRSPRDGASRPAFPER